MIGKTISHYKILSKLGEDSMDGALQTTPRKDGRRESRKIEDADKDEN